MLSTKRLSLALAAVIIGAITSVPAMGEARSGFSLFGGYAAHHGQIDFVDPGRARINYDSQGYSIGVDYQHSIWGVLSLGIVLSGTMEDSEDLKGTIGHGLLALQFRGWAGEGFFAGFHVGLYSLAFDVPDVAPRQLSGNGTGYGLVVGWEWQNWTLTVQVDDFRIPKFEQSPGLSEVNASAEITGGRLHLGYRW